MKNWTLALALGTAVTSTVIGTMNPASAISISGPGGGGSGSQVGNILTWNEYFTGAGLTSYIDKIFDNAVPGQNYEYNVNVRNDSGLTWNYFQFAVIGSQAGTQVSFLNPPGISSAFSTGVGNEIVTAWTNGTVADDGGTAFDDVTFQFQIQTGAGFTGNNFTVRQYALPQPLDLTWAQWKSGTPLVKGDKKVTYVSSSNDFLPEGTDTVKLFGLPNEYIFQFDFGVDTSYKGQGSYTYKIEADAPFLIDGVALGTVTTSSFGQINKYVCAASETSCDGNNDLRTLTSNNGSSDPVIGGHYPIGPASSFLITDHINPPSSQGESVFQINNGFTQQVPEPLTILGTGVVLGALPALKKEYAKRNKKKDGNA